ncbi:MAG: hypothetical protein VX733_02890 [Candidatus Latescibacterota bacterium]|nr:hypothetical protein [Candidatus Latescibacterota bacterium]
MPDPLRAVAMSAGCRRIVGLVSLLLAVPVLAPASLPQAFHPAQEPDNLPLSGLVGNSITDIVWSGRHLWVATERGLARWDPALGNGLSPADWITFTEINGLGRGSVSALVAVGDTVWAATVVDSIVPGVARPLQTGTGLSVTVDGGTNWRHIANETIFDTTRASFEAGPRTSIQNGCFGLAAVGDTVWATFFAGSSVRSPDLGWTWERVIPGGGGRITFSPTDIEADVRDRERVADSLATAGGDPQRIAELRGEADSLAVLYLQHRTFAVVAYGDTVWIGTSSGLVSSFDYGQSWTIHRVRPDTTGEPLLGNISANWVVAIERDLEEYGGESIWAGANVSEGPGQVAAMNRSTDLGESWQTLGPTFAWDFAFANGDTTWAGTNEGLLVSADGGATWEEKVVADPFTREKLRPPFIGVERVTLPSGEVSLWSGADNGLGCSLDGGTTWTILSSPVKTPSLDRGEVVGLGGLVDAGNARTYAAPSPFAPSHGERSRIVYSLSETSSVTIEIFDFASRRVVTLLDGEERGGDQNHGENWDGLNEDGEPVANGVYFYRIKASSGNQAFGSMVLLD